MDGDGEGLEKSSCIERDVVWNSESYVSLFLSKLDQQMGRGEVLMTPNSRMINSFLKRSLKMRDAFRTTPKLHFLAKVVSPFSANSTLAAWNAYFQCNSVSN